MKYIRADIGAYFGGSAIVAGIIAAFWQVIVPENSPVYFIGGIALMWTLVVIAGFGLVGIALLIALVYEHARDTVQEEGGTVGSLVLRLLRYLLSVVICVAILRINNRYQFIQTDENSPIGFLLIVLVVVLNIAYEKLRRFLKRKL